MFCTTKDIIDDLFNSLTNVTITVHEEILFVN